MTTNKPEEAMTDRGLLELAAKAAGYSGKRVTAYGVVIMEAGYDADPLYWNPLEDDGDALRLAVRLGFMVEPGRCWHTRYGPAFGEDLLDGEMRSTRRAIVRAAASIGKDMLERDDRHRNGSR